ncbi:MAG: DUF427 domain-containing protein [Planctomycetota bacterium]
MQSRRPRPNASQRPDLQPGQEWVWDFPRPPLVEPISDRIEVWIGDDKIVDTTSAVRVCETSHPPTYYMPPRDIDMARFLPAGGGSFCEWKGGANYWDYQFQGQTLPQLAWSYDDPTDRFASITGHLAMYAAPLTKATVGGHPVTPQPGRFYGGWITPHLVGPFKGDPETLHW